MRVAAGRDAVRSLVEKGAGLLAGPRRGEIADGALPDLDTFGHLAGDERHGLIQAFASAHRHVMPEEDAVGREHVHERGDDVRPHRLEAGGKQLGDDIRPVAVDDERRQSVPLAVHDPPRIRVDPAPAFHARRDALAPPRGVDRPIGALQQAEPDLRAGRVQGLPEEAAARISDADKPCVG